MLAAFFSKDNPVSIFHMGGDEVNFNCWAKDDGIRKWMREHKYEEDPDVDNRGYVELWGLFQVNSLY